MSFLYEYELGKATDVVARDFLKLKAGETCIITADTENDIRLISALARSVFSTGALPMVILIAAPLGVGQAADPMIPKGLAAALAETDAWIENNNKYIFYSETFNYAHNTNQKLRHLSLEGMRVSNMIRCIGRIDYPALEAFLVKISQMTKQAKKVRITTPAGQDVQFENLPDRPVTAEFGKADKPGSFMQPGQVSWTPDLSTVNGVIVFDGAVNPPIGILKEPIRLYIERGEIKKFEGGKDAIEYESWLKHFNHPQMLRLAHASYGFNPGARLSENNSECERVWGVTQWGIGNIGQLLVPGGVFAPSHSDGICLNSSVWLDGVPVTKVGRVVHPALRELAERLGK